MSGLALIVEDDEDDALFLRRALERARFPLEPRCAADGAEALELLFVRREPIRLVVLDLKLPKIGGLEVLKELRACPATASLPVAVLTASDEPRDREECERMGASLFLRKPVDTSGYDGLAAALTSLAGRIVAEESTPKEGP